MLKTLCGWLGFGVLMAVMVVVASPQAHSTPDEQTMRVVGKSQCMPDHYVEWKIEFNNCMCTLKRAGLEKVVKITGTSQFGSSCKKECSTQFARYKCA